MEEMEDFKILILKTYTVYLYIYICVCDCECVSDRDCAGWTVRSKHQQHQAHWAHWAHWEGTIIKQQRGFICSVQI